MNHRNESRSGLYRSRTNKHICGVCGGLAEFLDCSASWIRFGVILLFVWTGFWPMVVAYFIAAIIMKPEPAKPIHNEGEREFYDSYMRSPKYTLENLKHRFDQLDRRIRRMEDVVTNRGYEWERRFRQT